ncbi:MAG: lytic transglycosylase domain-containing protein [Terriglobia bacterium]
MSALHNLIYRRIVFCRKCHRSMFVGVNPSYVFHLIRHTAINKVLILLAVLALISVYPSTISIMSARKVGLADFISEEQYQQERKVRNLLKRHADIPEEDLQGLTSSIVRIATSKKLDPRLVASVIVVESRGNPTAISASKAVGLMQIHVPTWATTIDFTEKNPFDPEVNIEIGSTILANYISHSKDLESALFAYVGAEDPSNSQYVSKVLEIYNSH